MTGETPKQGRPPKYEKRYAEQAYKLALLGLTNDEMADVLGIALSTFHKWRHDHKEFSDAVKSGKHPVDVRVAESLLKRALGYAYEDKEERTVETANGSTVTTVVHHRHEPPNVGAMVFWLKNRQPRHWKDKVEQEVTHQGINISLTQFSHGKKDRKQEDPTPDRDLGPGQHSSNEGNS